MIEVLPPLPSLPDKVFTADIGFIDQQRFIMGRFRYLQRQSETTHAADWVRSQNYQVVEPSLGFAESLESSDICLFRGYLLTGYGFRTTLSSHISLAYLLKKRILSIEFVDPRLYHLDMAFCSLDERRAIVTPAAWSRRSCELIEKLVPEPLVLELDEALTL
jgi:N-dimethylarginine dimethylaminohydrolase